VRVGEDGVINERSIVSAFLEGGMYSICPGWCVTVDRLAF
jgi:hypothetical protein